MEDLYDTKQVIVWRKDLKVRKGKVIAQCCHASMKAILDNALTATIGPDNFGHPEVKAYMFNKNSFVNDWLSGIFTKIVVYVESELELFNIYNQILSLRKSSNINLPYALIRDAGKTEFHGVPTYTCLAVGPWSTDIIDKITGALPLL